MSNDQTPRHGIGPYTFSQCTFSGTVNFNYPEYVCASPAMPLSTTGTSTTTGHSDLASQTGLSKDTIQPEPKNPDDGNGEPLHSAVSGFTASQASDPHPLANWNANARPQETTSASSGADKDAGAVLREQIKSLTAEKERARVESKKQIDELNIKKEKLTKASWEKDQRIEGLKQTVEKLTADIEAKDTSHQKVIENADKSHKEKVASLQKQLAGLTSTNEGSAAALKQQITDLRKQLGNATSEKQHTEADLQRQIDNLQENLKNLRSEKERSERNFQNRIKKAEASKASTIKSSKYDLAQRESDKNAAIEELKKEIAEAKATIKVAKISPSQKTPQSIFESHSKIERLKMELDAQRTENEKLSKQSADLVDQMISAHKTEKSQIEEIHRQQMEQLAAANDAKIDALRRQIEQLNGGNAFLTQAPPSGKPLTSAEAPGLAAAKESIVDLTPVVEPSESHLEDAEAGPSGFTDEDDNNVDLQMALALSIEDAQPVPCALPEGQSLEEPEWIKDPILREEVMARLANAPRAATETPKDVALTEPSDDYDYLFNEGLLGEEQVEDLFSKLHLDDAQGKEGQTEGHADVPLTVSNHGDTEGPGRQLNPASTNLQDDAHSNSVVGADKVHQAEPGATGNTEAEPKADSDDSGCADGIASNHESDGSRGLPGTAVAGVSPVKPSLALSTVPGRLPTIPEYNEEEGPEEAMTKEPKTTVSTASKGFKSSEIVISKVQKSESALSSTSTAPQPASTGFVFESGKKDAGRLADWAQFSFNPPALNPRVDGKLTSQTPATPSSNKPKKGQSVAKYDIGKEGIPGGQFQPHTKQDGRRSSRSRSRTPPPRGYMPEEKLQGSSRDSAGAAPSDHSLAKSLTNQGTTDAPGLSPRKIINMKKSSSKTGRGSISVPVPTVPDSKYFGSWVSPNVPEQPTEEAIKRVFGNRSGQAATQPKPSGSPKKEPKALEPRAQPNSTTRWGNFGAAPPGSWGNTFPNFGTERNSLNKPTSGKEEGKDQAATSAGGTRAGASKADANVQQHESVNPGGVVPSVFIGAASESPDAPTSAPVATTPIPQPYTTADAEVHKALLLPPAPAPPTEPVTAGPKTQEDKPAPPLGKTGVLEDAIPVATGTPTPTPVHQGPSAPPVVAAQQTEKHSATLAQHTPEDDARPPAPVAVEAPSEPARPSTPPLNPYGPALNSFCDAIRGRNHIAATGVRRRGPGQKPTSPPKPVGKHNRDGVDGGEDSHRHKDVSESKKSRPDEDFDRVKGEITMSGQNTYEPNPLLQGSHDGFGVTTPPAPPSIALPNDQDSRLAESRPPSPVDTEMDGNEPVAEQPPAEQPLVDQPITDEMETEGDQLTQSQPAGPELTTVAQPVSAAVDGAFSRMGNFNGNSLDMLTAAAESASASTCAFYGSPLDMLVEAALSTPAPISNPYGIPLDMSAAAAESACASASKPYSNQLPTPPTGPAAAPALTLGPAGNLFAHLIQPTVPAAVPSAGSYPNQATTPPEIEPPDTFSGAFYQEDADGGFSPPYSPSPALPYREFNQGVEQNLSVLGLGLDPDFESELYGAPDPRAGLDADADSESDEDDLRMGGRSNISGIISGDINSSPAYGAFHQTSPGLNLPPGYHDSPSYRPSPSYNPAYTPSPRYNPSPSYNPAYNTSGQSPSLISAYNAAAGRNATYTPNTMRPTNPTYNPAAPSPSAPHVPPPGVNTAYNPGPGSSTRYMMGYNQGVGGWRYGSAQTGSNASGQQPQQPQPPPKKKQEYRDPNEEELPDYGDDDDDEEL